MAADQEQEKSGERSKEVLRGFSLAILCPPEEMEKPNTDLLDCIISQPRAQRLVIGKDLTRSNHLFDQFIKERDGSPNNAKHLFDRSVLFGKSAVLRAIELAQTLDNSKNIPFAAKDRTEIEELYKLVVNSASRIGMRHHLDPALTNAVRALPSENNGAVDRTWLEIIFASPDEEEREQKTTLKGHAKAAAERVNREIWEIYGLALDALDRSRIVLQNLGPKEASEQKLDFNRAASLMGSQEARQLYIDRNEAHQALFHTIGDWGAVEYNGLRVLREAFPDTRLDQNLGGFVVPLELFTLPKNTEKSEITSIEAELRANKFSNFSANSALPRPWLTAQFLRAQYGSLKQEDGEDRAELWSNLIAKMVPPPGNEGNTEYNSQVEKLKAISGLSYKVGTSRFSADLEIHEYAVINAKDTLASAVKARQLAQTLPAGYERNIALIITASQEAETREKLSKYKIFAKDPLVSSNQAVRAAVLKELAANPLTPASVLDELKK